MAGTLEYGARFKMRRTGLDDSTVTYEVTVERHEQPELRYTLHFRLLDGTPDYEVVAGADASDAPAWISKHVGTLGRQLAKGNSWPRLFQRWRAEG